jgi:glycosyltransferase involved in cell wall biosynthesis
MRKIALIPVYNEESTLLSVLRALSPEVDEIVIVDDGSSDGSLALAEEWARSQPGAEILSLHRNLGMSAALREGFFRLAERLESGDLAPRDLLLTLDADGQHDSREIAALCQHMERNALDVGLTRRDFSLYPRHKRLGNRLMTVWGTFWSGFRYSDVESGFRAMRLEVLPALLDYYTGYRYSCAQEIAVLTARLGFCVDNGFLTVIRLYRSQTSLKDVAINSFLGFWAFARWALRLKVPRRPALALRIIPSEPAR